MKKIVLILISLAFIVGCGFTPKTTALNHVQKGISKQELVRIMKEPPHGKNYKDGYDIIHYKMFGPKGIYAYYFTFDGDILVKWEGYPIPK